MAKKKADQSELRERRRLDRLLAPYFVSDPAMTIGLAGELYEQSLQTPIANRNRMLSPKGHAARYGRTKNQ